MASKKSGSKAAAKGAEKKSGTKKQGQLTPRLSLLVTQLNAGGSKADEALGRLASLADDGKLQPEALSIAEQVLSGPWSLQALQLLRYLLSLGMPGRVDALGSDTTLPAVASLYARPSARALVQALTAAASTLVSGLGAAAPELRAETAHLLGLLPGAASHTVERLAGVAIDGDRGVRAAAAIALGHLAKSSPLAVSALIPIEADPDPLLAGLAAVGLYRAGEAVPSLEDRLEGFFRAFALYADIAGRLRDASERDLDWPERFFSWNGGALDVWVFNVLGESRQLARGLARAVAPAPRGIDAHSPAHVDWVERLLAWHFPERESPLPDFSGLDSMQRDILSLLSEDVHHARFAERGLPSDTRSRRRMLGLDPACVLDRLVEVKGRRKPIWLVISSMLDPEPPHPALAQKLRAMGIELTDGEWLDVWFERAAGAYDLASYKPIPPAEAGERFDRALLRDWALATLQRCRDDRFDLHEAALGYVFAALARALPKGESPPEWCDELFNFSGRPELAREGFACFPPARRERIAERAAADPRAAHVDRVVEWPELAPKAAARFASGRDRPARARVDDARFLEHVAVHPQLQRAYVD